MANPLHILTVEDEEAIRELLTFSLEREGHKVFCAANVPAAKAILSQNRIDIALVDWMLPGGSGISLIRAIRADQHTQHLPVIMITARTEEQDVTQGLDAGADDYVCKPFSPKELHSRINALLRRTRSTHSEDDTITVGPLHLNKSTLRAYCDMSHAKTTAENENSSLSNDSKNAAKLVESEPHYQFDLGHTEFKLLRYFMEHSERVLSREHLLDQVWGMNASIEERTVDVHILRLRKLLKPAGVDGMLETVRGAGYRLSTKSPEN